MLLLTATAAAVDNGDNLPIEPLAAEDLGVVKEAVDEMRTRIMDEFTTQAEAAMEELGFTEELMHVLNDTGKLSEMADRATEQLEGFMEALETSPDFLIEEMEPLMQSNPGAKMEDVTGFCSPDQSNQRKTEKRQTKKAAASDRAAKPQGVCYNIMVGGGNKIMEWRRCAAFRKKKPERIEASLYCIWRVTSSSALPKKTK